MNATTMTQALLVRLARAAPDLEFLPAEVEHGGAHKIRTPGATVHVDADYKGSVHTVWVEAAEGNAMHKYQPGLATDRVNLGAVQLRVLLLNGIPTGSTFPTT